MLANHRYAVEVAGHLVRGHSADPADVLGDHQVWAQSADRLGVDVIERPPLGRRPRHCSFDAAAVLVLEAERRSRDDRKQSGLRRVVAFVSDGHQLIAEAECE